MRQSYVLAIAQHFLLLTGLNLVLALITDTTCRGLTILNPSLQLFSLTTA